MGSSIDRAIRIKVDDRGEIISSERLKVNGTELSCLAEQNLRPGTLVRIVGFEGQMSESVARVIPETDRRHEVRC